MSDKQFHKRYSDDYQDEFEFHDHLKILKFQQNLADINISDKTFFSEIKKEVIAHRCKVLVIDNITFLSRDALESAKEANDLMKVLKQLKSELALSILIIAHTPKRAPYKPISLKDMAGSSGLSRFADAVICIGKSIANPNQIYIKQLKVRSAEFQYGEDNVILMTIKKVNNFLGAYFQGYDHERNHLKSAGPTELEQEILDLHSGNEMSRREIAQRVGCDKMKVQRTLQKYQDDAVST
jgi:RecA-family ATPase